MADLFDDALLERSNAEELRRYIRESRGEAADVVQLLRDGVSLAENGADGEALAAWVASVRRALGEQADPPIAQEANAALPEAILTEQVVAAMPPAAGEGPITLETSSAPKVDQPH